MGTAGAVRGLTGGAVVAGALLGAVGEDGPGLAGDAVGSGTFAESGPMGRGAGSGGSGMAIGVGVVAARALVLRAHRQPARPIATAPHATAARTSARGLPDEADRGAAGASATLRAGMGAGARAGTSGGGTSWNWRTKGAGCGSEGRRLVGRAGSTSTLSTRATRSTYSAIALGAYGAKAAASAATVGHRRARSFWRHCATIAQSPAGTSGCSDARGVGSSVFTRMIRRGEGLGDEGRRLREELEQDDPERPCVAAPVDVGVGPHLLRGHVKGRPEYLARHREALLVSPQLRDAEVEHLDRRACRGSLCEEQVRGLEIPMDDPRDVRLRHYLARLEQVRTASSTGSAPRLLRRAARSCPSRSPSWPRRPRRSSGSRCRRGGSRARCGASRPRAPRA